MISIISKPLTNLFCTTIYCIDTTITSTFPGWILDQIEKFQILTTWRSNEELKDWGIENGDKHLYDFSILQKYLPGVDYFLTSKILAGRKTYYAAATREFENDPHKINEIKQLALKNFAGMNEKSPELLSFLSTVKSLLARGQKPSPLTNKLWKLYAKCDLHYFLPRLFQTSFFYFLCPFENRLLSTTFAISSVVASTLIQNDYPNSDTKYALSWLIRFGLFFSLSPFKSWMLSSALATTSVFLTTLCLFKGSYDELNALDHPKAFQKKAPLDPDLISEIDGVASRAFEQKTEKFIAELKKAEFSTTILDPFPIEATKYFKDFNRYKALKQKKAEGSSEWYRLDFEQHTAGMKYQTCKIKSLETIIGKWWQNWLMQKQATNLTKSDWEDERAKQLQTQMENWRKWYEEHPKTAEEYLKNQLPDVNREEWKKSSQKNFIKLINTD